MQDDAVCYNSQLTMDFFNSENIMSVAMDCIHFFTQYESQYEVGSTQDLSFKLYFS